MFMLLLALRTKSNYEYNAVTICTHIRFFVTPDKYVIMIALLSSVLCLLSLTLSYTVVVRLSSKIHVDCALSLKSVKVGTWLE